MTLRELRELVTASIRSENQSPPSVQIIDKAINQGKNAVVRILRTLSPELFITTTSYSVSGGDTSITLPTSPPVFKILSVYRTDRGFYERVALIDYRDRDEFTKEVSEPVVMYQEGNLLKFARASGASGSMTLELKYLKRVADLDGTDIDASFSDIPEEWQQLIAYYATALLLPTGAASNRWQAQFDRESQNLIIEYRTSIQDPVRVRDAQEVDARYWT